MSGAGSKNSPSNNAPAKSLTVAKQERRDRLRRFYALINEIHKYDSTIDGRELLTATKWALDRQKSRQIPTVRDAFSDPLLIAEGLVDSVKADRVTLLASVLYPSVRNHRGEGVDHAGLKEIGELFGGRVHDVVVRTLKLRSLNHLALKPGAEQSRKEQLRLFNLMSAYSAEEPAPIALRVQQKIENVRQAQTANLSRAYRDETAWTARYVSAPTAYIAGFPKLRKELHKEAFLLDDPAGYAEMKRRLDAGSVRTVTEEEWWRAKTELLTRLKDQKKDQKLEGEYASIRGYIDAIDHRKIDDAQRVFIKTHFLDIAESYRKKDPKNYVETKNTIDALGARKLSSGELEQQVRKQIGKVLKDLGVSDNGFHIEMRDKTPESMREKMERKGETFEQIGDRYGIRIILSANLDGEKDFDHRKLASEEREVLLDRLAGGVRRVYAELSRKFGRGRSSRDRELAEEYKYLAIVDPRVTPAEQINVEGSSKKKSPEKKLSEKLPADDRYEDNIKYPKPSGYSAIKDTIFLRIGGRLIPFECQIVDEIRHDVNTHGPRTSHMFYKTGLENYPDALVAWYQNAQDIVQHNRPSQPKYVAVFDELNQIHVLPNGATVTDLGKKLQEEHKDRKRAGLEAQIAQIADLQKKDPTVNTGAIGRLQAEIKTLNALPLKKQGSADVENDDPFVGNRSKVEPDHPLQTGDRVHTGFALIA